MSKMSKVAQELGDEQVVEVGWNFTHIGHYLKPFHRAMVEIGEGGVLLAHSRGKLVPLADFLKELTSDDGPPRLCRVWLITDAGKERCCWYYNSPEPEVDRRMLEHFASNARGLTMPAPAVGRAPSP